MKLLSLLALASALAFSGCASVAITPKNLATAAVRGPESEEHLRRWQEAVWLCNQFLGSEHRKTLPAGEVRLGEDAMEFVTAERTLPCRVRCTRWGDVLVKFKMAAQERSDGFVVGLVTPRGDRLVDNSFFKQRDGAPVSNVNMAALILHEITHSYYRLGTVDFLTGLRYYAEAALLIRYREHSMERLPYQTNHEFAAFIQAYQQAQAQAQPGASQATMQLRVES